MTFGRPRRWLIILGLIALPALAATQYGIALLLNNSTFAGFPAASAANTGGLIYDTTNAVARLSSGAAWNPIADGPATDDNTFVGNGTIWQGKALPSCSTSTSALQYDTGTNAFACGSTFSVLATETADYIPLPESHVTGNATRVANTTFDGASYIIRRPVSFNRIVFRATGQSGAPTARILIYQTASGGSGVASLKATCATFAIAAPGNFACTPSEGTVTLTGGLIYVLFGRDSAAGSWTARTSTTQSTDLLNGNMDVDTHPTSFTTTIAANTSPATFDPRESPTGSATGTSSDVTLVVRLKGI